MWHLLSYLVALLAAAVLVPWVWITGIVLAAKAIGAPVLRAGLGIGPTLIERTWGDTPLRLGLVPLGGTLSLDPRPERAQILRRMALTFVGPTAVALAATLALFFSVWSELPATVPPAVVGELMPDGPAQAAGLRPGDRITAIDGEPIRTWDELRAAVAARPGRSTTLSVERPRAEAADHGRLTLKVTPRTLQDDGGQPVGQIGVAASTTAPGVPAGEASAGAAWSATRAQIQGAYASVFGALFGRSQTEVLGGPVVVSAQRHAAERRSVLRPWLLSLLLLAPLCLLPLPPLPGGQLPLLGLELVRGRALSARARLAASIAGVSALVLVTLYAFSRDLLRFLTY